LLKAISIESYNLYEKVNNMLPWMRSEDPYVRMEMCKMIYMMVQNPFCLEKYMENTDCLKELMSMVKNDNNDEVRVIALAAITSESQIYCDQFNHCTLIILSVSYLNFIELVCQNIPVFNQFFELGGKDLIFNSLKSPIDELKIKAILLVCSTCHLSDYVMGKL
jgi:hypothetical protein